MLGTDQNVQIILGKQQNSLYSFHLCYGYTFLHQHLNEIRSKQNMPVSSVLAVMITQQRTPWGRAFLPRVTAAAATLAVALKVKEQPLLVLADGSTVKLRQHFGYTTTISLFSAMPIRLLCTTTGDMEQHFPTKNNIF